MLSDADIVSRMKWNLIDLAPYDEDQLQACSYDVRLDNEFLVFESGTATHLDPKSENPMRRVAVADGKPFVLHPGEFVLGSTVETVSLGNAVAARLEGKSSLGRLGLLTHATAGFIDAGFSGHVTLELANVANLPLQLWPGMKIGQLCFFDLLTPSRRPYDSERNHYQGQRGPTPSKSHLQF
jgi:dCTP deaminase